MNVLFYFIYIFLNEKIREKKTLTKKNFFSNIYEFVDIVI